MALSQTVNLEDDEELTDAVKWDDRGYDLDDYLPDVLVTEDGQTNKSVDDIDLPDTIKGYLKLLEGKPASHVCLSMLKKFLSLQITTGRSDPMLNLHCSTSPY